MIVVCVSPSVIPRKFVITCQIDFRRSVRVREEGREGGDEPYCEEGERDSVALDDRAFFIEANPPMKNARALTLRAACRCHPKSSGRIGHKNPKFKGI